MKDHLRLDGKLAPPHPPKPDFFISSTIQSAPLSASSLVLYQSPHFMAPLRKRSCKPYTLVKMRSSSFRPPTWVFSGGGGGCGVLAVIAPWVLSNLLPWTHLLLRR
ncbi:hypothetical protein Vadar_034409 [Vaccinium darrowii]|uniref:Uncharacterized protein n=1 Tax=Vaccinium darrowii TaxID=229202 RepID=A0ACB7YAV1_9ERIC|nr:hypothetical protein Vadar_034409 [Vaccinium darrowii]